SYASLILHGDGIVITPEKIATLVKSANVKIDSYWPGLFSKLFEKRSILDLILNAGSSGAPVAVATSAAGTDGSSVAAASTPAAEEKKEEAKEESDEDMGFSLFE
ncbi:Ribosomal_60s domain-containing protein, partial [Cephalotus follicularis]